MVIKIEIISKGIIYAGGWIGDELPKYWNIVSLCDIIHKSEYTAFLGQFEGQNLRPNQCLYDSNNAKINPNGSY